MDTTEPRSALHLKMNLKKQQLQGEHFSQIERENQLLMNKIYHIMNDEIGEKATEYLPGVRITKNQMPTVDCHINEKTRTIIAGKAILSKSLNFEAWERKYNKICEENKNMQDRLRDRKVSFNLFHMYIPSARIFDVVSLSLSLSLFLSLLDTDAYLIRSQPMTGKNGKNFPSNKNCTVRMLGLVM